MKIKLLVILSLYFLNIFSQKDRESMTGSNINAYYSQPFSINKEALSFFASEMELANTKSFGQGLNFELRQFEFYFNQGIEYMSNRVYNEDNSLLVSLTTINLYLSLGYGIEFWERIMIGAEMQFGCLIGFQNLTKMKETNDLYAGYVNNSYNSLVLDDKFAFNFGLAPYSRIRLMNRLSLSLRYQYYFLNMEKLGKVNEIPLYEKYSSFSVGLVFEEPFCRRFKKE